MKIEEIAEVSSNSAEVFTDEIMNSTLFPDLTQVGEVLASFKGEITIPNIEKMPSEFYEALVKHKGKRISFPNSYGGGGIKLTVRDAEILSRYQGALMFDFDSNCRLPGRLVYPLAPSKNEKQEIEDEISIAKAFRKHQGGDLELQNISILSTKAASELFAHRLPVYISSSFHAPDEGACGTNPKWIREQLEAGSVTEWDKVAAIYRDAEKRWFPDLPEGEYPTRTRFC
jgi:hypothetical protein